MLVTIPGHLLSMVGIGFWALRSTRNVDDYDFGGRSLVSVAAALAAGAPDRSEVVRPRTAARPAKMQATHQQVRQILRDQGY